MRSKDRKSLLLAYLLLFLLGPFGCHNFYVERKKLARTELFLLCSSIVCFLGSVLYGSSFFHAGALVDAAVDISGTVDNAKTVAWVVVYTILAIILLVILLLCDLFSLPSVIRKTNANSLNAKDLTKNSPLLPQRELLQELLPVTLFLKRNLLLKNSSLVRKQIRWLMESA